MHEKYGVREDLPEDMQKLAARGCPLCGKEPEIRGQVLLCPEHGSEPFERAKRQEEEGR